MTEVPEYLLQRSKARRRALGLAVDDDGDTGEASGGGGGGGAVAAAGGGASSSPTELQPIPAGDAPTPAAPNPAVSAARSRKKVPVWAALMMFGLPVYLFVYTALLGESTEVELSPVEVGGELYAANCASCHGGAGGGGVGRALNGGEVIATFPDIESMFTFVRVGNQAGVPYGDPNRDGGQRIGAGNGTMPPWPGLSDAELYAIVRYEREELGGEELSEEELAARDALYEQLLEAESTSEELVVAAE